MIGSPTNGTDEAANMAKAELFHTRENGFKTYTPEYCVACALESALTEVKKELGG